MSKENIVLQDGKELSLKEIMTIYPSSVLFFDVDYIDFCIMIARKKFPEMEEDFIRVYINLLFLKSKRVQVLFYLFQLNKKSKIKEINISFINESFRHLFSKTTKIHGNEQKINLLPKNMIVVGFMKLLVNRTFILFRRQIRNEVIIKSWVEVSEKIFKEDLPESQVLIYPFPLKLSRQLKYIYKKTLKSEKICLMGVPYKIKYLFKAILKADVDFFLTEFEFYAAIDHAKYFAKSNKVRKILTTEEFESGSYIFGKELIKNDIEIVNKCHGLAIYSPYVYYSKFHLINEEQKNIYGLYNKNVELEIEPKKLINHSKEKASSIVFIDQGDLYSIGLFYESFLREKLLEKLNRITKNIYIKPHPNTKKKEISRIKDKYKSLNFISDLKSIDEQSVIFLNLFSTSYYDYQSMGEFYFIKDEYFKPSFFFGKNINEIHINDIEIEIQKLI